MLQIDNALISLDVFEKKFVCELSSCKGECPIVEKYMTPEGKRAVKKQGKWVIDSDGDKVTPLVNNEECAYTYKNSDGTVFCAIEKAFLEKEIKFQKPLSCHLYPVRITKYNDFDAVNYETNKLCIPARILGEKLGVPLYKFIKGPLIRKYGKNWYKQLEVAAKELGKDK